jgi:hypothetical protein
MIPCTWPVSSTSWADAMEQAPNKEVRTSLKIFIFIFLNMGRVAPDSTVDSSAKNARIVSIPDIQAKLHAARTRDT